MNLLYRVPLKIVFGLAATPAVLLGTLFLGGNTIQMMLAPVGGFALGAGLALGIAHMKKLPLDATVGDYVLAMSKAKAAHS